MFPKCLPGHPTFQDIPGFIKHTKALKKTLEQGLVHQPPHPGGGGGVAMKHEKKEEP